MTAATTTTTNSFQEIFDPRNLADPNSWVGAILLGLILLVAASLTGRAVRMAVHRYLDKTASAGADPTGIRFLGKLGNVLVYILAFLVYTHLVPPLEHLGTALLTSMGVLSVVVGLATQSTLGNLISGVSLVLYRPFRLGDRLQVAGPKGMETGVVESINLGTTVLRTADDRRLVIPNNTMSSQIIINLSATRKGAPCSFSINIAADADAAAARRILTDLAKAHPRTVAVDECSVTALSAAGMTVTLTAWCADDDAAAQLKSDLLESVKKKFDAAGIKLV